MYKIRTTTTGSDSTAVQVIYYSRNKLNIAKHIGSSNSAEEVAELKLLAQKWIKDNDPQLDLFEGPENQEELITLVVGADSYLGVRHSLLQSSIYGIIERFNFSGLKNRLLVDLVFARIVSPGSKAHSLKFLAEQFDIRHSYRQMSRVFPRFHLLKSAVEANIGEVARREFLFDFKLLFYDLTTLYFESFDSDDLRKIGFSKDNKNNQPQIMIGLLVTKEGFPISYQVFEGNIFEGHTLIPAILELKKVHKIEAMTVVADAAMISRENIRLLKEHGLNYIVGARISNLPLTQIKAISRKIQGNIEANCRIDDQEKGFLVCGFSPVRYKKDKIEMEKQIKKAAALLTQSDAAQLSKRAKFLKKIGAKSSYEMHEKLIEKTKLLLGIKGYFTNLDLPEEEIILQYKNLWHVEKAFRISKTDLKMRPIYHYKPDNIKSHIMVCFMALAVAKYIEIKTQISIKATIDSLKQVTTVTIHDKLLNKNISLTSPTPQNLKKILAAIQAPY